MAEKNRQYHPAGPVGGGGAAHRDVDHADRRKGSRDNSPDRCLPPLAVDDVHQYGHPAQGHKDSPALEAENSPEGENRRCANILGVDTSMPVCEFVMDASCFLLELESSAVKLGVREFYFGCPLPNKSGRLTLDSHQDAAAR